MDCVVLSLNFLSVGLFFKTGCLGLGVEFKG